MTAELAHHITPLRKHLEQDELIDTPERVEKRVEIIFAAFYDDEPDAPTAALQDALTDLAHEAHHRGVDFDDLVERATSMAQTEREEWSERDAHA